MPNYRNKNKSKRHKNRNKNQNQNTNQRPKKNESQPNSSNCELAEENAVESVSGHEEIKPNVKNVESSQKARIPSGDEPTKMKIDEISSTLISSLKVDMPVDVPTSGAVLNNIDSKMGMSKSKNTDKIPSTSEAISMGNVKCQPKLGKVIVHRISYENETEQNEITSYKTSIVENNGAENEIIIQPIAHEESYLSPPAEFDMHSNKDLYKVEHPDSEEGSADNSLWNQFIQVQIQEINDEGSTVDSTDNPPLISEIDSEPEADCVSKSNSCELILDNQLKIEAMKSENSLQSEDETRGVSISVEGDLKLKRAQKRAALETHFLPQLLSPRYLDSIVEENSDMSDARSDCSENTAKNSDETKDTTSNTQFENEQKMKRANAVFPRSSLDFSKKHKHVFLPKKSQVLPTPIREEPLAMVVEAKLIECKAVEESCSRLSSDHKPESEAAEVVFIDSASSSLSDLLELDSDEVDDKYRSAVDLNTDAHELISNPSKIDAESSLGNTRESTPVNQPSPPISLGSGTNSETSKEFMSFVDNNKTQQILRHNSYEEKNDIESETKNKNKKQGNTQLLAEASEHMRSSNNTLSADDTSSQPTSSVADSKLCENLQKCDSNSLHSKQSANPELCEIIEMNSVREIISSGKSDTREVNLISNTPNNASVSLQESRVSIPDLPIAQIVPPQTISPTHLPLNSVNAEEEHLSLSSNVISEPMQDTNFANNQQRKLQSQSQNPLFLNFSLSRQESADSHCSDSTTHSQCTAINVGFNPSPPIHSELTPPISTVNVSELWEQRSGTSTENIHSSEASAIKKLRLLCTETLASMPYGEQVLEELATVAQDIGNHKNSNMPLSPHINDLRLSNNANTEELPKNTDGVATVRELLDFREVSPPPPPIPAPPTNYNEVQGLLTDTSSNLLDCLSPTQRLYMQHRSSKCGDIDKALDAHKKGFERCRYHEYTDEQLKAMGAESFQEQQILKTAAIMKKLRKSLTPPPPPPPPPPVPPPPVPVKSAETAAKAHSQTIKTNTINDASTTNANERQRHFSTDGEQKNKNKHRLLTIISDTDAQASRRCEQEKLSQAAATSSFQNSLEATASEQAEQFNRDCNKKVHLASWQSTNQYTGNVNEETKSRNPLDEYHTNICSANMQSVHSELPKRLLEMDSAQYMDNARKRFSNIESSSNNFHSNQLLHTTPKRYSNIETHSYEAQKRTENGKVISEYNDTKHESRWEGDQSLASDDFNKKLHNPFIQSEIKQDENRRKDEKIMSAVKLDGNNFAPTTRTTSVINVENANSETEKTNDNTKNRNENEQTILQKDIGSTYDEFQQRAKAVAEADTTGIPSTGPLSKAQCDNSILHFGNENIFKDFDELTKQLHMELETNKVQKEQREKAASLYDLNRIQWQPKEYFNDLKKQRHEHMKELEQEIEKSMKSRKLRTVTNSNKILNQHRDNNLNSFQIPNMNERDISSGSYDKSTSRVYEIPITLEASTTPSTFSSVNLNSPWDLNTKDAARFRRAESMFNLTDHMTRQSLKQPCDLISYSDKYTNEQDNSENISRPFAREVDTCYQRIKPRTIRAPRLSVSTNDLSTNFQGYDSFNPYNTRRTQAPMACQTPQRTHNQYSSCFSVLERDPHPTYISTTTRRGVSPAPPVSPSPQMSNNVQNTEHNQRRASLPKEIHEQQLKYITSKEEELKMEFERLENERRRLLNEISKAPTLKIPRHPTRDIYRPASKLPTLSEDEVFRQQMAEEWLNKIAEREERRLQKIIKISKVHETSDQHNQCDHSRLSKPDISEEFLKRVKERRSKLSMPADSDWESGAESQPVAAGNASESDDVHSIKVIEGKKEADLRQLPRHLREFAKFSDHQQEKINNGQREVHLEEERSVESNENSISSAFKKSSIVKTIKVSGSTADDNCDRGISSISANSSAAIEKVFGDTEHLSTQTQKPLSTISNSPMFLKLPATFGEMFATSPFKNKIYEEFEQFWRSFNKSS